MSIKDTPKPFSGTRYHRNVDASPNPNQCCAICGKFVKNPLYWVEVIEGGARFADTSETERPDSLGAFPLGPECAKSVPPSAIHTDVRQVSP